jgi:sulfotransferase
VNKTFFFMAGLPRSGSTLLSAILNQNPEVYSGPQTDLVEMMYLLDSAIPSFESYKTGYNHLGYKNAITNLGQSFYSHIEKPFVIDKNRAWSTPYNLNLAKLLNPDIKIIVMYRPILEILTSFIVLANKYPGTNFIDIGMESMGFYAKEYRDIDDARCDWLLRPNGEIDQTILGLSQAKLHLEKMLLIDYNRLVQQPQQVLTSIYSFLNIPNFKHNLSKITQFETHEFDQKVFGIPELHQIRTQLTRVSKNPKEVLSEYVVKKYGHTLDFIQDTSTQDSDSSSQL